MLAPLIFSCWSWSCERLLRDVRARDRLGPAPRLEAMAKAGNRGADRALRLAEDPTGFCRRSRSGSR